MTNRDRRICVHQQKGQGFPHDVASAEHDRRNAFGGDAAAPQNLHHSQRRAGDQARLSANQSSEVDGMKAVYILLRVDSFQNSARIHLARKGNCTSMPSTSSRRFKSPISCSTSAV